MNDGYITLVIYKDKDMNEKITLKQPVVESMDETGTLDIDELPTSFVSVDIPVWADRAIGDTVVCYFGLHRQTKIVRDLTSLVFYDYDKNLFDSGQYIVYYTITDTAGNTNTSEILTVTVVNSGGGQSPENIYPQPVLGQADKDVIDLGGLTTDIFVTCYPPNSPSVTGDILRVHFGEITVENTLSYPLGFSSLVTIPKDKIHHGNYAVFYEVLQNGTRIGYSPSVEIQCETDVVVYPPVFPQAVDSVIDLDSEFSHVEMDIPHFDAAEYGVTIKCTIGEVETSIVIENSSDLTFKALFDKMLFNEGVYIAKYTVILNDDYRVYSEQCSISFSHGGTVEPPSDPFLEQVWSKLSAGIPFRVKVGPVRWGVAPHMENEWIVTGPSIMDCVWHPEVVPGLKKTIRINNQSRQSRWATSPNVQLTLADMDFSAVEIDQMYDCFQISTNNEQLKSINISCLAKDGSLSGLVHSVKSAFLYGAETHLLACNDGINVGYSDFYLEFLY